MNLLLKPFSLTALYGRVGEALEQLGFLPDDAGERGLNEWTARR